MDDDVSDARTHGDVIGRADWSAVLTAEQLECLGLVNRRLSSKEIARRLGIGPSAVDKRLERAVRAIGATSRFDAARRVFDDADGIADATPIGSAPTPVDEVELRPQMDERPAPEARSSDLAGGGRLPSSALLRIALIVGLILAISMAALTTLTVGERLSRLWASDQPIWDRNGT